ncbi:DUF1990 domain-containing protein [Corynebacterium breve]|uniref:DUF1990 domain-containing protein n=1 Tax=Corynebacterium breve TaxID=3049799 RepID=A0ABY8VFU9_9CORY|nr:DUF1990 domain-containing protein [Corynebacterium breve]WIM68531.1 DUF1990 domain-containing protein [Corynebacterium breve]
MGVSHPEAATSLPRLSCSRVLPTKDFDTVTNRLLSWSVQRSFFSVRVSDLPLQLDSVIMMKLGVGRLSKEFGCRVVALIDEAHCRGFAYGTLPGHVESGEERFVVKQAPDGTLTLHIDASSEPATWWLKAARPIVDATRWAIVRVFYLRSLDRD